MKLLIIFNEHIREQEAHCYDTIGRVVEPSVSNIPLRHAHKHNVSLLCVAHLAIEINTDISDGNDAVSYMHVYIYVHEDKSFVCIYTYILIILLIVLIIVNL